MCRAAGRGLPQPAARCAGQGRGRGGRGVVRSGEPLEIAQRDDDRPPVVERHRRGLEDDPGREAVRAREAREAALGAGVGAGAHPDVVGRGAGQVAGGRRDEQRWLAGEAHLDALEGGEDLAQRPGDPPPDEPVEDEDGKRRQPMQARPLASLGRRDVAAIALGEGGDDGTGDAHGPGTA